MKKGFFCGLFDFNGDGKLDPLEKAVDFAVFNEITRKAEQSLKLKEAGLDGSKLASMNEAERNEVLEEAGINPDDFKF